MLGVTANARSEPTKFPHSALRALHILDWRGLPLFSPRSLARLTAFAIVTCALSSDVRARAPVSRELTDDSLGGVTRIAQDRAGFLWFGTNGGLVRYDGATFRPWARDTITRVVDAIAVGPDDSLAISEQGGGVYLVSDAEARELLGPEGSSLNFVNSLVYDNLGRLWLVRGQRRGATVVRELLRRESDGSWSRPLARALPDPPYRVLGVGDRVMVATEERVFQVESDTVARALFDVHRVRDIAPSNDRLWVAGRKKTYSFTNGVRRLVSNDAVRDVVIRGDTAYGVGAHSLYVLRDDQMQPLSAPGGTNGLVDAEGSLWVVGNEGARHYPEPDTLGLGVDDGVPAGVTLYLARGRDGALWVATWQGTGVLGNVDIHYPQAFHQPCTDAFGATWISALGRFVRHAGGDTTEFPDEPTRAPYGRCARAADGTVWFARRGTLVRTGPPSEPAPVTYESPFQDNQLPFAILEDSRGRLWLSSQEVACFADATRVRSHTARWTCRALPANTDAWIVDLVEADTGEVWAAVRGEGVFRFDGSHWQLVRSSLELRSRWLYSLVPSPRGGVWVLGREVFVRVVASPGQDTWTIVEEPSFWNGVLSNGVAGPHRGARRCFGS